MVDIERVKSQIIHRLKPIKPLKVILFGSFAYGKPNEESDIDLYVVTQDDFIPKNFKEKNELYLKVSRALRDLRKEVAIDLIVHSKKMYEAFKKSNNNFYKNDIKNGIELL